MEIMSLYLGTSGYGDVYSNNICILENSDLYELGNCDVNHLDQMIPYFANNRYYTKTGNISVHCGKYHWTLEQFQARGFEIGTKVSRLVPDDEVIRWGKELFNI